MTRIHLKSGLSDGQWFALSVEEAKRDPVGLWEIVKAGRQGFGLQGAELEAFVKDFVMALLKGGALPVLGDKEAKHGWLRQRQYGDEPSSVADSLVDEWRGESARSGCEQRLVCLSRSVLLTLLLNRRGRGGAASWQ